MSQTNDQRRAFLNRALGFTPAPAPAPAMPETDCETCLFYNKTCSVCALGIWRDLDNALALVKLISAEVSYGENRLAHSSAALLKCKVDRLVENLAILKKA